MNFKNVFRGSEIGCHSSRWTGLCKHVFVLLLLGLFSVRALAADTLLILGDSLSAGYRMPAASAWPALLDQKWQTRPDGVKVVNASISGDTAGQGLARLPALLKQHQPRWVLIELGGNDGLRGFPPNNIEQDLSKIITLVEQAQAQPLLMQIRLPTNYGRRYNESFSDVYPRLAKQFSIPLVPFFMEQVYLKPEWILEDGIHPARDAQPFIADWMAQQLESLYPIDFELQEGGN
ncbi:MULTISPECIES: multifunctional acyl-CoA thioesterase I/protease I/lysophospholipase L1 [Brenneria]|nr:MULTISPECIES: multifunctional acyl-CoA thioesterase I/protease I/lysophospholipase L1 [Brenneria]